MNNVKLMIVILMMAACGALAQFAIPADAVLIESNQLKSRGGYVIEQRWRLRNGEIMYACYESEGATETINQRIENKPILAIGKDVSVGAMPGIREFKFNDRRILVQFMKMMGLSFSYDGDKPEVSDSRLGTTTECYLFTLSLDLYDGAWSLLKETYYGIRSCPDGVLSHNNYAVRRKK